MCKISKIFVKFPLRLAYPPNTFTNTSLLSPSTTFTNSSLLSPYTALLVPLPPLLLSLPTRPFSRLQLPIPALLVPLSSSLLLLMPFANTPPPFPVGNQEE